jgi:hypothetical protein
MNEEEYKQHLDEIAEKAHKDMTKVQTAFGTLYVVSLRNYHDEPIVASFICAETGYDDEAMKLRAPISLLEKRNGVDRYPTITSVAVYGESVQKIVRRIVEEVY